jgi:hypothetical protein
VSVPVAFVAGTLLFFLRRIQAKLYTSFNSEAILAQETIEINENLLKIDNVLNALDYLLEEVRNRKDNILADINFNQIVRDEIRTDRFRDTLSSYITGGYSDSIYRDIAFIVMERIDNDIAAFINARVDERLEALGITAPPSA